MYIGRGDLYNISLMRDQKFRKFKSIRRNISGYYSCYYDGINIHACSYVSVKHSTNCMTMYVFGINIPIN